MFSMASLIQERPWIYFEAKRIGILTWGQSILGFLVASCNIRRRENCDDLVQKL